METKVCPNTTQYISRTFFYDVRFCLYLSPIFSFSDFKLNAEELERWFNKIDHIFEHTRIPTIGEILTPFYKISVDRERRHHLPMISHINYK